MTTDEREEKIQTLLLVTGWNRSVFENMLDTKIQEVYQERVINRG